MRNRKDVTRNPSVNSKKVKPGFVEANFCRKPQFSSETTNSSENTEIDEIEKTKQMKNVADNLDPRSDTMLSHKIEVKL